MGIRSSLVRDLMTSSTQKQTREIYTSVVYQRRLWSKLYWGHALQRITTKHFYTKYDMGFTYYAPVYAYEWVFEKLLHLNDLRLFSGNQVYISCKHGQSPIKRYRREDYTYDLWTYMDFDRYGWLYHPAVNKTCKPCCLAGYAKSKINLVTTQMTR